MLVLIWSKEKTIVEELLKAYWKLFFDPKQFTPEKIALNLIALFSSANLTEKTSLEELLTHVLDENKQAQENEKKNKEIFTFNSQMFKFLWNIYLSGFHSIEKKVIEDLDPKAKADLKNTRSALEILRISFSKRPDLLESKFDSFAIILGSFLRNNVSSLLNIE